MAIATSPCMHCLMPIECVMRSRFDGFKPPPPALYDRGWFCSPACRDAERREGEDDWDRMRRLAAKL